jgi:hypothetical protein
METGKNDSVSTFRAHLDKNSELDFLTEFES